MEAHYYDRLPYAPPDWDSLPPPGTETLGEDQGTTTIQEHSFMARIGTIWTLVMHCVLSVAVTLFVLAYLADRHFNVTERTPPVQVVGGTQVAPFLPMQSDIVTLLSILISALKCALAAWVTSLCWNVALFLMERHGFDFWDFKMLLDYGLLTPNAYSKDLPTWIIGALLLASCVANFSSPILTGSITWVPSNQLAHGLSVGPIQFDDIGSGTLTRYKELYYGSERWREQLALGAVGTVGLQWEPGANAKVFKRVSNSVQALAINSTIETIILPYFEVHSIQWITDSDVDGMPSFRSLNKTAIAAPLFNSTPIQTPPRVYGHVLLIPNATTNWSNVPMEPTMIRDTRLLLFYYGYDIGYESGQPKDIHAITQYLPPNAYQLSDNGMYFAFAWVTFSAGVGQCKEYQCIVSSPFTIQNNTQIELEPHRFTLHALSMAPIISLYLVAQNTSLPYPWSNLNNYIEAILVRSYSGAWDALTQALVIPSINSSYVPSFPGLRAQVNQRRVYIWLGIQLLVTLLSVLFLFIRFNLSKYPPSGSTSLTGFFLDTTGVPTNGNKGAFKKKMVLKIEPRGDRLKVKVE